MVSEEKESRPFQTGRIDEAHCFFRFTKCGKLASWPLHLWRRGQIASSFLSAKVQILVCSPCASARFIYCGA